MRIVADTNTVLSGLLWQGPPRCLIDLARQRSITLFISLVLLAELAEVIARDKFALRVLAAQLSAAISRDPDDDHVLACAAAAQVDLIVTRDKDLLVLNSYQHIPIVPSAEALRLITSSEVK